MKSILVVRLDALGDTLLSTPAVKALTERYERVTVVTKPVGTPVMRPLAHAVETLTGEKFDAALVFTEKRAGLRMASSAPVRVGFDPGWSQPLKTLWVKHALTHRVPFPNDLRQDPGLHEVERYCKLVEALGGGPVDPGPLLLTVPPALKRKERAWMGEHLGRTPVGVQLTPKWGVPDEVLLRLMASLEGPVLALYGPAERAWAEPIVKKAGVVGGFRPDLLEYAALLSNCRQLVSVDTGAVHVAAALGIPTVAVFPHKHHEHCVRRWRPWKVEHRVVLHGEGLVERVGAASGELSAQSAS